MRVPAFLALITLSAAAEPPRYGWQPGDSFFLNGEFRFESITRRGGTVEKLAFKRAGSQRGFVYAREGDRLLFALEIDHEPARATAWLVDGKDRLASGRAHLEETLPPRESDLAFLSLDGLGRGAHLPLDPELSDAVLRILSEVEVMPEGDEAGWNRKGEAGLLSWEGAFTRSGTEHRATFRIQAREKRGGTLSFEEGRALMKFEGGRPKRIEGWAAWTVGTEEGSERREVSFELNLAKTLKMESAELADMAADSPLLAAADEAWETGEGDRALEIWDKAAGDATNRWAERAKARAALVRAERPMLGKEAPALQPTAWIGSPPGAGKWRVVYFWATWARPCEADLDALAGLVRGRDVGAVAVTAIDGLQTEEQVRNFVSRKNLPFPSALDDGSALRNYKVQELPRLFLIDPEGRVRFEGRGHERETLRALLGRFIPE